MPIKSIKSIKSLKPSISIDLNKKFNPFNPEVSLKNFLKEINIVLSETQVQQLVLYLTLLIKWNKAYNLTAVRSPSEMLTRHIFDSLLVVAYIHSEARLWDHLQPPKYPRHILDIGTGAGLPGIIMAICFPEDVFYLLDSNGKKTRFLTQVVHELGLKNTMILNNRIKDLKNITPTRFNIITSRAFSALSKILTNALDLLNLESRENYILSIKSNVSISQELKELDQYSKNQNFILSSKLTFSTEIIHPKIPERYLDQLKDTIFAKTAVL